MAMRDNDGSHLAGLDSCRLQCGNEFAGAPGPVGIDNQGIADRADHVDAVIRGGAQDVDVTDAVEDLSKLARHLVRSRRSGLVRRGRSTATSKGPQKSRC